MVDVQGVAQKAVRRRGRLDPDKADLVQALGVRPHRCAERPGQQLRAQADAEEGAILRDPALDPLDLVAQIGLVASGLVRAQVLRAAATAA
jgi:hypothetical protein